MKHFKFIFAAFAATLTLSCSEEIKVDYQTIPRAEKIEISNSGNFIINVNTKIVYTSGNEAMEKNAKFLASYLNMPESAAVADSEAAKNISLVLLEEAEGVNPEGYKLEVSADGVEISSTTPAGIFYGIQTLRKSIPAEVPSFIKLPYVTIEDAPRFGYRGMMLDVSRHFRTVDEVKIFIDMLALHNMNRFHWHLSEDQGWRIEIKAYPRLTEIGSKRKETVIGKNTGKYDGIPHEGFYTQEEIKDVVKYAADRYIEIVPEIDLPGHMLAALTSYPELGCTGGPYEVWTKWGVSDQVLCAGNAKVMSFLQAVLGEVIDLFPSEYIHIGGDECPKTSWAKCPKCQSKIKELGIKGDDKHSKEEYLQSYIIKEVEKFINSRGRKIIGWDEILEGGLSKTATVMSWRGEAGGLAAARMGNNVIMTPNNYLYFDYYQAKDTSNEPFAIGGFVPLEKVYSYEPYHKDLTEEEKTKIIGVQANIWTEYMKTLPHVQYMALPRMAALAEVQWSTREKDFEAFKYRLADLMKIYKAEGYNYANHLFEVKGSSKLKEGTVALSLNAFDNAPIYYTLDGSEPNKSSKKYTDAIIINKSTKIKAVSISENGTSKVYSDSVTFSKATGKTIVETQEINKKYGFDGVTSIVDGKLGENNFNTGDWIAWHENDMEFVLDLGKEENFTTAGFRAFVSIPNWIFAPKSFTVSISDDGENFKEVATMDIPSLEKDSRDGIYNYSLNFDEVSARYVKYHGGVEKSMPQWHQGAGRKSYIFVDEIVLN